MTARRPEPVRYGTGEQLARVAHFAATDLPDGDHLDDVAWYLIGAVDDTYGLLQDLRGDLAFLWRLLAGQWAEGELDELSEEQWARLSFPTQAAEVLHRYDVTRQRVAADVEAAIRAARHRACETYPAAAVASVNFHEDMTAWLATGAVNVDNPADGCDPDGPGTCTCPAIDGEHSEATCGALTWGIR